MILAAQVAVAAGLMFSHEEQARSKALLWSWGQPWCGRMPIPLCDTQAKTAWKHQLARSFIYMQHACHTCMLKLKGWKQMPVYNDNLIKVHSICVCMHELLFLKWNQASNNACCTCICFHPFSLFMDDMNQWHTVHVGKQNKRNIQFL